MFVVHGRNRDLYLNTPVISHGVHCVIVFVLLNVFRIVWTGHALNEELINLISLHMAIFQTLYNVFETFCQDI